MINLILIVVLQKRSFPSIIYLYHIALDGFDNTVYQNPAKHGGNALHSRKNTWSALKRPRFSSSTSQKTILLSSSNGGTSMNNQRRHKTHHRPTFAGPIENVTVNVGREATLECLVNHLDKYKVKVP